jgi:hypothetical protein
VNKSSFLLLFDYLLVFSECPLFSNLHVEVPDAQGEDMSQQFVGDDEVKRENMQVLGLVSIHKSAGEETAHKCDQEVVGER